MSRIRMRLRSNERGQSLIIVALFFFFAFLVFSALAVDGTMVYLRRRQLQNMADAAALAAAEQLSSGKPVAGAYDAAEASIAENHGRIEWYSTDPSPNPPTTNVPTGGSAGVNLIMGIEIANACNVRVALLWADMGTYFTQFFGRQTLQVGAKAHAGCNRAGGLMPIAVKRFGDELDWDYTPPPPNTNNPSTIYCDDCDTRFPLSGQGNGDAFDFLKQMGVFTPTDVITTWPTGTLMYQSPPSSIHANPASPGREYFILGGGVVPNVGTTSYAGWVNMDIRHLSSVPREYFNGVTQGTNPNTLKNLGEYYIRRGYCCDIPVPGDEVAMLSGVSADFAAKAFQDTYRVGDIVAVIVYNGTVYHAPNLDMSGSPTAQPTRPTTTTVAALNSAALTYTIHLQALDGFTSSPSGITMNVEGLNGFANWSFSNSSPVLPYGAGILQRDIYLHITPTVTTTTVGTQTFTHVITGSRAFYVSAYDDEALLGTGIRRYWAGVVTVGDKDSNGNNRNLPAVTAIPTNTDQNFPFDTVVQGNQAKYNIELDLWGGASTQNVTVNFVSAKDFGGPNNYGSFLPPGFTWVSSPPWTTNTKDNKHPGGSFGLNIKVADTAIPNKIYELSFLASAGAMTHPFKLYVFVVPPQTTTVEDYVDILGYAALEVMAYPSVNSVRGRIISELMSDPNDLKYGLRARLIPWEIP